MHHFFVCGTPTANFGKVQFSFICTRFFCQLRVTDFEQTRNRHLDNFSQKILVEAIKNERALILIDEVFKGTNTKERIEAAKLLINKLNDYNQLFLITTHDEEICDNKNIINYHFEEYYINDEILNKGEYETFFKTKNNFLKLIDNFYL